MLELAQAQISGSMFSSVTMMLSSHGQVVSLSWLSDLSVTFCYALLAISSCQTCHFTDTYKISHFVPVTLHCAYHSHRNKAAMAVCTHANLLIIVGTVLAYAYKTRVILEKVFHSAKH